MSENDYLPGAQVPDARLRAYGGRFIPEALIAAVEEVAAEYARPENDPAFKAELDGLLLGYTGRPSLVPRSAVLGPGRRLPGPAQARGPRAHRVAQDQQRARPGAAHEADGQDPDHRRDRRRPARRGHRHRCALFGLECRSTWARRTPSGRR